MDEQIEDKAPQEVLQGEVVEETKREQAPGTHRIFIPDTGESIDMPDPDKVGDPRKNIRYCGAKTRTGGRCHGLAMSNGRCRMHGGTAQKGMLASNFKHGRYSKHLPLGLLENYERSRRDPEILALTDEISLVDSRLVELLGKLDKGESGRLWISAGEVYGYMVQALKSGDVTSVNRWTVRLGDILSKGRDEYGLWRDIGEQMDRRRSLAEAERKRLVEAQFMVDVEQARTLVAALAASVRKHVTDPKSLQEISEDFMRLTSQKEEI